MKNSTKVGIIVCLAILLALSFSVAFAGTEKTNATKSMTNNVTKNMTNVTKPFAKVKGAANPSSNGSPGSGSSQGVATGSLGSGSSQGVVS
jgi:hypothetical protein